MNMSEKNTGKPFEKLAESIFKKLRVNTDDYTIQHNVFLDSLSGKREFDIILKSKIAGFDFYIAIECKDHNSKISITEIDKFESKLRDVNIQKGILISRKGFSSKAIAKAKRVNISLCTAHQALNENWKIDLDIPIFIKQIRPIRLSPSFEITLNSGDSFLPFPKAKINNVNVVDCFTENWENNRIEIDNIKKTEIVHLPEITTPFLFDITNKDGLNLKREVKDFKMIVEFEIKYFSISLNELRDTEVLKNITDNKTQIFFNLDSLKLSDDSFTEIKKKDFENNIGVSIVFFSKPKDLEFNNWNNNFTEIKTRHNNGS